MVFYAVMLDVPRELGVLRPFCDAMPVLAGPGRIGLIARAAFVLVLSEHKMIT